MRNIIEATIPITALLVCVVVYFLFIRLAITASLHANELVRTIE